MTALAEVAVYVELGGCDDSTAARITCTPDQAEFLQSVATHMNRLAINGCKPRMDVKPWDQITDYEAGRYAEDIEAAIKHETETQK